MISAHDIDRPLHADFRGLLGLIADGLIAPEQDEIDDKRQSQHRRRKDRSIGELVKTLTIKFSPS